MVAVTDELLDEMVRAIVEEVDPEQVILFGSRARGDTHEHSDVDLIVIEAEPFGPERSATPPTPSSSATPASIPKPWP